MVASVLVPGRGRHSAQPQRPLHVCAGLLMLVHTEQWSEPTLLTISKNTFLKYAIALTYNWLMSIWCISGEARSGDCCQCHDMVGYNGYYNHRSYLFIYIYLINNRMLQIFHNICKIPGWWTSSCHSSSIWRHINNL